MYRLSTDIPEEDIKQYFLDDPALCYQSLHDYKLVDLYERQEYKRYDEVSFIGAYLGEELVFLMNYTYFSDIAINMHVYLKTKYQHSPMYGEIQELLREYFLTNTKVIKVIAMSPAPCTHVQKTCERYGFKLEGTLKNALTWRQEVVDLYIYGLMLKE
jgi:hypothetical protein